MIGALALLVWLAVVVLALAVTNSPLGVACLLLAVAALLAAKLAGVVGSRGSWARPLRSICRCACAGS